jgi:hypothetical protein
MALSKMLACSGLAAQVRPPIHALQIVEGGPTGADAMEEFDERVISCGQSEISSEIPHRVRCFRPQDGGQRGEAENPRLHLGKDFVAGQCSQNAVQRVGVSARLTGQLRDGTGLLFNQIGHAEFSRDRDELGEQ